MICVSFCGDGVISESGEGESADEGATTLGVTSVDEGDVVGEVCEVGEVDEVG